MALKDKQTRTIVLAISEKDYPSFMKDNETAHEKLGHFIREHPGLFPGSIEEQGYKLNGYTRFSKKLGIRMRRIETGGTTYRIRPSFVMPYMRARTGEVEHPLFLLKFGVPFWALAEVFGRNAMFWYRAFLCLGQPSLVGATVHSPDKLPKDLLADEFHTRIQGEKAYIATTVASGCFLGVEASNGADEASLKEAYGVFRKEALALDPGYQPQTVNTDGWWATQKAWRGLFHRVFILECFLHAFLKIRDRATKKLQAVFGQAADKVWEVYNSASKRQMGQRIRRLADWAGRQVPECPMKENLLKLCQKRRRWLAHFDFPDAYHTSSQLDRLMRVMERHAVNSQMFHATLQSTSKNFRALALLYNFSPSCPALTDRFPELISPAARLNGYVFHQDWLQNLLIASSLGGFRQLRNPL
jgi:hypothetical protein